MNKEIFFKQANKLINEETIDDWRLCQAKALLEQIQKESDFWNWVSNPMIQTILSLLNPFVNKNYKIQQAVKLLLEGLKDAKVI